MTVSGNSVRQVNNNCSFENCNNKVESTSIVEFATDEKIISQVCSCHKKVILESEVQFISVN